MMYIKKMLFVSLFAVITSPLSAMFVPVYRIVPGPEGAFNYIPEKLGNGLISIRVHWSKDGEGYSAMVPLRVLENIVANGVTLVRKGQDFDDLVYQPEAAVDITAFRQAVRDARNLVNDMGL